MRVGVDLKTLALHGGGIGTFIRAALPRLMALDADVEYVGFGPSAALAKLPAVGRGATIELWKGIGGLRLPVYDQWQLRRAATSAALDVLYSPYFDAPVGMNIPTVVTMHDAVHLRYPELYPLSHRLYYQNLMRIHGRRAAAIVTDSNFSKSELVELAKIAPDRICVVPLALLPSFVPARDDLESAPAHRAAVLRRYGLPAEYVLYSGGVEARKNVRGLLSAYGAWKSWRADAPPLVLTGSAARYTSYAAEISRLGEGRGVYVSGRVTDEDMPYIYRQAVAVVYPSFYEGFGFPLLEAMASGVPMTCSCRGSLREVGGNAVLYFEPSDTDEIAGCLDRVTNDEALRADLVAKGLERVKTFTIERTVTLLARAVVGASGRQP